MRIYILFLGLCLLFPAWSSAQVGYEISGQIRCTNGSPVANASVTLRQANGSAIDSTFTNTNGTFSFTGVPATGNYSLQAALQPTSQHLRAISITDAVAARQHILGLRQLPETNIVAMDINNNALLTTLDIVLFRKYLLREPDATFQPAWVFMHPNGTGPQEITNLSMDITDLSWIALLRGDGNSSGCPE
ncbi:MAG: carboxypeptidase regulatory-like domain-containing protein [Lewinellaceae bacterium]|nr:carboxypeptidase regulatory-like domain-containing protein [Lewinellaceae bacterium]